MIKVDLLNESLTITEKMLLQITEAGNGCGWQEALLTVGPTSTSDQVAQGCGHLSFECPPRTEVAPPPWAPVAMSGHPHSENISPI